MESDREIIIIGGGHAGIEAALAAARMGRTVLLLSSNLDRIGWMSCNPSIGGLGKSQLVREVDALGGQMGLLADATGIQFRMLNTGKGPAVQAIRSQNDRSLYARAARTALDSCPRLCLRQDMAARLILGDGRVAGVVTESGREYRSAAVVIATGTFLNGLIHIGGNSRPSGRAGDESCFGLSKSLSDIGLKIGRLKTGTPARVAARSVDYARTDEQPGDADPRPFSYRTTVSEIIDGRVNLRRRVWPALPQVSCRLTWTNRATHDIIRGNLDRSPLYGGKISGIGPRYCPSIEDKVVRFPERCAHQVFLEPEGLDSGELYLNGLSSSLPEDVQEDLIRSIAGLERAEITRPGYAVEYDFVFPDQLHPWLEAKDIPGLYLAGQVNGSSGYEEAAAQGLMAGINAALACRGEAPLVLRRDEAYIGVLIDDLVTKGVREPYRMFTSRAEYRLLLRQDNADQRLMEHGRGLGLLDDAAWEAFERRRRRIAREVARLRTETVRPDDANGVLASIPTPPLAGAASLADLLRRPEVGYRDLLPLDQARPELEPEEADRVAIEIKYDGYVLRQRDQAERLRRFEALRLAPSLDYGAVRGIATEARQMLSAARPATLGQAARISGVSPADIALLLTHLKASGGRRPG